MTSKSVYLAHPYADQELGLAVQAKIEALGIRVVNPFQRKEQEVYSQVVQTGGEFTLEQSQEIVDMDLSKIENANGVIAIFTGKISIGTSCETIYARAIRKPVFSLYLIENLHGFSVIHPWVKALTHVSTNIEQLVEKLQAWQSGKRLSPLMSIPNSESTYARYKRRQETVEVLAHYGSKCACCGFADLEKKVRGKRFLQLDHIAGGGSKEINATKYGGGSWLLKQKRLGYPAGYRVLCGACNQAMEPNETVCELHKWEKI